MILLVSTCTWRCGTALKLHQPHLQTLAPNGASIQKSHSITTSEHCSWCETKWLRRRSCTLKSSCPTDPPWSLCGALPTYTPHTGTSKTNTCRTKQSETEQRKTALTMLYPDTQKNATRLPCTHWHAHTWSQRECRRGERGGVRQHAKRRMSKKHWDQNFYKVLPQIWGIDGVTGLTIVCVGTECVFCNQIG